jgi:hypothetical protein
MKIYEILLRNQPDEILFTVKAPDITSALKLALQTKRLDFESFNDLFILREKEMIDERVRKNRDINLLHG